MTVRDVILKKRFYRISIPCFNFSYMEVCRCEKSTEEKKNEVMENSTCCEVFACLTTC